MVHIFLSSCAILEYHHFHLAPGVDFVVLHKKMIKGKSPFYYYNFFPLLFPVDLSQSQLIHIWIGDKRETKAASILQCKFETLGYPEGCLLSEEHSGSTPAFNLNIVKNSLWLVILWVLSKLSFWYTLKFILSTLTNLVYDLSNKSQEAEALL